MKEDNSDIYKMIMVFLALLLVCITSCIKSNEQPASPRFTYGSKVFVTDGFYKGCKGTIDGQHYVDHSFHYSMGAICPYGKSTRYEYLNGIEESLLVEDLSDGA